MPDIEKGGVDRPRDQGVVASRIETDKKEKPPFVREPGVASKTVLISTFFSVLKKLFTFFSSEEGSPLSAKAISKQGILETLSTFKKLLGNLAKEDLSENPLFAQELSETWIKLIEGFDQLQVLERKGSIKVALFRAFLEDFKKFPLQADHSFAYYLVEHAGKDWLPFPFIEILRSLHLDFVEKTERSLIRGWMDKIEELIREIKKAAAPLNN